MSAPSINESLTEDHDRLDDLLESFREWKAKDFAKAKGFLHSRAAGFVAHVRAVRQIVRAELPGKKLITKGSLVTRSATGIKGCGVGCWQGVKLARHELESFVPGDRLVMGRARLLHHGMNEPSLQLEPVIAVLA